MTAPGSPEPRQRSRESAWLGAAVLGLAAAAYLGSLGGGWVWDDVYQLRDNPAITRPGVLATHDVQLARGARASGLQVIGA